MLLHAIEMAPPAGTPSRTPLVLLHGLFGSAGNFGQVQKRLAQDRRVVALDLRNHGASPHDPAMGYRAMAADVAETLAALGVGPAAVLGHSMGGKVAMALALARPALVERLLVVDIAPVEYRTGFDHYLAAMQAIPLRPGLTRREAGDALAAAVPETGVRGFLLQNLRFDATPAWRIGLSEIAGALGGIEGWDVPPGRYDGPTLFIGGERSDYIRPEYHPAIRALFAAARFATIAGVGHWVHAEQPERFLELVQGALAA